MNGSIRAQVRQAEGWVEGTPKYASSEPHHVGQSMCYREMYHAGTESMLTKAIETKCDVMVDGCWIRRIVSPENIDDYDLGDYFLVRSLCGNSDMVKIPAEKVFDFQADSEYADEDNIIQDCYSASVGNFYF